MLFELKDSDIEWISEDWRENEEGLPFNQKIIEEIVKNLTLKKCPVCATELKYQDDFDNGLPNSSDMQEKYCEKDNYIIQLSRHNFAGNTYGSKIHLRVYTNSRHSRLVADASYLAEIKEHVELNW